MKAISRFLALCSLLIVLVPSATAKKNNSNQAPPTIPVDPSGGTFHLACQSPTCPDNGSISYDSTHTPIIDVTNVPKTSEFTHFWLLVGVPNNLPGANGVSLTAMFKGTGYTGSLFGPTAWTSGSLFSPNNTAGGYLNLSKGSPSNPLSAFLPFTQAANGGNQPSATGYFVYLFNLGDQVIPDSGTAAEFTFCVPNSGNPCTTYNFAGGTLFDVFATSGVSNGQPNGSVVQSMPQSQAVILNPPPPVPEPTTLLLLGSGFAGIVFRRRK